MPDQLNTRQTIRMGLEQARTDFHTLLDVMTEQDALRQSHNAGWTNGEILTHMTFGFVILAVLLPLAQVMSKMPKGVSRAFAGLLNALTVPFNWINRLGARMQAKVFTYAKVGKVFDRANLHLMRQLNRLRDDEWQRGMYYPARWDDNFSPFMTLEKLFRYPVIHFNFHREQISPTGDDSRHT